MNTQGLQQIGKGAFSTVYKKTANKVLIKSSDTTKLAMSECLFPKSSMFPVLTKVGSSNDNEYNFYEEKYYPKVSSLKQSLTSFEYEWYQELRRCSYHHKLQDAGFITKLPNKFGRKKAILATAVWALLNYNDSLCFEISPRNVAVHNKKLILLDCFFYTDELYKYK